MAPFPLLFLFVYSTFKTLLQNVSSGIKKQFETFGGDIEKTRFLPARHTEFKGTV
jgi:hypothetical protein